MSTVKHHWSLFALSIAIIVVTSAQLAISSVLWFAQSSIRSIPPLVSVATFSIAIVAWVSWELVYGSAFAYFFPLHGARHVPQREWLIGVSIKVSVFVTLSALIFSINAPDRSVFFDTALFAACLTINVLLLLAGLFHRASTMNAMRIATPGVARTTRPP